MADTQEEPVSIEEQIASVIDGQEQEDESEKEVEEIQSRESDSQEEEEQSDEIDEVSSNEGDDKGDGENSEESEESENDETSIEGRDISEDETDETVEDSEQELDTILAPEHWSAQDKEIFNDQPRDAQEWMLKRHKELEGDYTRKRQQESSQVRLAENVADALAPFEQEFSQAGLDHAGAVRKLASVHSGMKGSPIETLESLAQSYTGKTLAELAELESETADPGSRAIQQQLGELKSHLSRQEQAAQQRELERISGVIQSFKSEKDESGNLLYPHFDKVEQDIAKLMESGMVERGNLTEGYKQATRLRGLEEYKPQKPQKPSPKEDQAEKVKRAKRAATGVKSSGAVGKKDHSKLSLEEQIASEWDSRM